MPISATLYHISHPLSNFVKKKYVSSPCPDGEKVQIYIQLLAKNGKTYSSVVNNNFFFFYRALSRRMFKPRQKPKSDLDSLSQRNNKKKKKKFRRLFLHKKGVFLHSVNQESTTHYHPNCVLELLPCVEIISMETFVSNWFLLAFLSIICIIYM